MLNMYNRIDKRPGDCRSSNVGTILLDLCPIFLALPKSNTINHGFLDKPTETSEPALHLNIKYYSPWCQTYIGIQSKFSLIQMAINHVGINMNFPKNSSAFSFNISTWAYSAPSIIICVYCLLYLPHLHGYLLILIHWYH